MQVQLLVIDPQVDFCDPKGALSVAGADRDMRRLAEMVRRLAPQLSAIHVTLDSHHLVDVAHPIFWKDRTGSPPAPFTIITAQEVAEGHWTPALSSAAPRALAYVTALEKNGRYPLCIWPPHCLIGSPGHAVMPVLFAALRDWEQTYPQNFTDPQNFTGPQKFNVVDYVPKGSSIWTEHYSAIQADVPDPADPGTQLNTALIESLAQADLVAVAGEAGSHCVASTVRDLAAFGGPDLVSKIVLLEDAVSPVAGFEVLQDDFRREMSARGMKVRTTVDFLT